MSILIKDGNAPKDKRDYIVAEHEVEFGGIEVLGARDQADSVGYNFDKSYDVALVQDTDDFTGEVKYYWILEMDNKKISPAFPTSERATAWMREQVIRDQVMRSKS